MERNPVVSDEQVEIAVHALAELAKGGSGTQTVHPPERIRAAEALLAHAWVYGPEHQPVEPAPSEEA